MGEPAPFERASDPPERLRLPPIVIVGLVLEVSLNSDPGVFWSVKLPAMEVKLPPHCMLTPVDKLTVILPNEPDDKFPLDGPVVLEFVMTKLLAGSRDSEPARIVLAKPEVLLWV